MVVVDRILLADYLKRPNLVMQIEGNQLYYSDIDLWAENLQTGIYNTLLAWLNDKATETRFIAYDSPDAPRNLERLVISIKRFMPTDQGKVITSGQYWHVNKAQTDGLTSQESFAFTSELSQQGYSHSVTLLAEQLLKLSNQIINDIE
ncbi:ABC-type transport auxiliary lipoprotein family protein [Paraglaciecola sp. Hal342]